MTSIDLAIRVAFEHVCIGRYGDVRVESVGLQKPVRKSVIFDLYGKV